jgi:uncharacterized Fe-S cluster-containing MiaB family protein
MGLDSSCDIIRKVFYQREIPLFKYKDAIALCQKWQIRTTAYVVLGNPFLSKEAAITDTIRSIEDAFDMGFSEVFLEPIALQSSTIQDFLYENGQYIPPTIWDVVAVLKGLQNNSLKKSKKLFLGGQIFTPIPYKSLSACEDCIKKAYKIVPYIESSFWDGINISKDSNCCISFDAKISQKLTNNNIFCYPRNRLNSLYQILQKKDGPIKTNRRQKHAPT